MIGLGAGTLATYGAKGDVFRFYDINPDVLDDRPARLHVPRRQRRDDRAAAGRRAPVARARADAEFRRARDRRLLQRRDSGAPHHGGSARHLQAAHEARRRHRLPRHQPLPQPGSGRRGAGAGSRLADDPHRGRRRGYDGEPQRLAAALRPPRIARPAAARRKRRRRSRSARIGGCGPTTSTTSCRC